MKQYTVHVYLTEESAVQAISPAVAASIQACSPLDALFSVLCAHGVYAVFAGCVYEGDTLVVQLGEFSFCPSSVLVQRPFTLEDVVRWLWEYIPQYYHCNPLSVSSRSAETTVARYAWEQADSNIAGWYQQASEHDRSALRDRWYELCSSLR